MNVKLLPQCYTVDVTDRSKVVKAIKARLPPCYNQSVLHFCSLKPNVILSLCECPLKETEQPRLSLPNLITDKIDVFTQDYGGKVR